MNAKRHFLTTLAVSLGLLLCPSCDQPAPKETSGTGESPEAGVEPGKVPVESRDSITSTPLPARESDAPGETLFERLDAGKTGIDFVNPIDVSHKMKYLYASAMGCGGVAVGDVNGDGRPDLYFTGGPRPNALYLQTGDLKFEKVTEAAGVASGNSWSTGASIIDIDNDGDLDIYVCNYDSANHLYLNNGSGKFVESAKKFGIDFVGAGHTAAFCDYDNDGDLDFFLMTNFFYDPRGLQTGAMADRGPDGKPRVLPKHQKYYGITSIDQGPAPGQINVNTDTVGQSDRLVQNNGDGTFTELTKPGQIIGKGNSVIWWDQNDDGLPDLYIANDFQDQDFFLRNRGAGALEEMIRDSVPHTTWFSMGTDSADLDGDGRPDLMVADMSGTNHFKQKVGMGAMGANADFLNTAVPRQYMRNTVYLNPGGGRLLEAAHMTGLANSDWTWTVRLSDFDNDGKVDVFLTNGMAVNLNVADNPAASQALPGETEWDKHTRAKTGPLKEQNLAFQNKGDLKFEDVSKRWGLDHVGMSYAATAADLDRDGDLEIIVANMEEPAGIYRNHSRDGNRIIVQLYGTRSNRQGLGATVRVESDSGKQVRFLTLNRGYMSSGEAVVHFGLGKDESIRKLSVRWPSGHQQEFENLKVNQHYAIAEPDGDVPAKPRDDKKPPMFAAMQTSLSAVVHRETPYDDYIRQPLLPHKQSQLGPGMAWGDIDADGDDDLFFAGARGVQGKLLRNEGGGQFSELVCKALANDLNCEDMGAVFFDSDGDGDLDLYVVSGGVECDPGAPVLKDRMYLNNGKGVFTAAADGTLPVRHDSGSVVVACDFDADGDLDLFVGGRVVPGKYPEAAESRILRNTGGKFADVTDEVAPGLRKAGLVTSALWSDANADGMSDLLVTCEWGPVRYFQNKGGRLADQTEQAGLAENTGWWNGIAGSDVDHDGDIDYAVTNFGLNTKYHASTEKPTHIFYGDFEGKGRKHVVEAEYEGDILYPVRGRSCSSNAMPFLFDKFETFSKFAISSVQQIYTENVLDSAEKYSATQLRSGLLINDGTGKFEFRPLPRIAQIAPGFGAAFSDVDGDGNVDLYFVQNFFSPQAETGHMAGGVSQLLRGNGDGNFTPVSPAESGLVVPGDAKSLTRVDLNGDGRPDFIVGVNDGPMKVFQNQGGGDADKLFSVRLRGKPGNTTGAGARVTVRPGKSPAQTAEVYAGSGYLSQSSATLTFSRGAEVACRIEVRWAGGKTSVLDSVDGKGMVEIKQPE